MSSLKQVAVAAAFAVCGWSSLDLLRLQSAFALPFVLLAVCLFIRNSRALFIAPAMLLVWYLAIGFVQILDARFHAFPAIWSDYLPVLLAGALGALGLALAAALLHPQLLSNVHLVCTFLLGAIASVPFGHWLSSSRYVLTEADVLHQRVALQAAFALWQSAVGGYLYTASSTSSLASGLTSPPRRPASRIRPV